LAVLTATVLMLTCSWSMAGVLAVTADGDSAPLAVQPAGADLLVANYAADGIVLPCVPVAPDSPEAACDFNYDGEVNFADYLILEDNFGFRSSQIVPAFVGSTRSLGDANLDGNVDYADFQMLDHIFNAPEPMSLCLLAAGVPWLLRRKR
jgi:hypothetical protein